MLCPIAMQAKIHPTALAIKARENSLSYQELDQLLSQAVGYLHSLRIHKGMRVTFTAPTSFKTVILLLALLRIGAVACPINPKLPQIQIENLFQMLKPFYCINVDSLIFKAGSSNRDPIIDTGQLFTFLATSGSSGTSKIACHTFGNYLASAQATHLMLKLSHNSRWLLSLPLYHVSGISILTRCITIGACIVLTDVKTFWEEILPLKITHLSCVPTQLFRLKNQKCDIRLLSKQLQCVLVGGAHTTLSLFQSVKELPIFFTYGMTEATSMITLATRESQKSEIHMGKPISCCEIQIKDDEIFVRGQNLFQGYWDGKQIRSPSSWFATKDLGKITTGLHITGRKDRLFISGGENIQPEEIEQALCSIKGISAATVLPRPDQEFGNRSIAFIEDIEQRNDFSQISFHLRKILPAFKCPTAIWPYPKHLKHYTKPPLFLLEQYVKSLLSKDAALDKSLSSKEEE